MIQEKISQRDRQILRRLAAKQMEYSQLPIMKERTREWREHHNFCGKRPMIHLEMGTFSQEIIPQRLECEGETARNLEWQLYDNFLNFELFDDDRIVSDYFKVGYSTYFTLFGQKISADHVKNSEGNDLGHRFRYVIHDLHEDADKLGKTEFGYAESKEETRAYQSQLNEIFGDILPVKIECDALYSVPTQDVIHMMGMEQAMFAMYDYPDEFKAMMNRIADDTIAYYRWAEQEGLIMPTTEGQWLGQGTFCYTDELPGEEEFKKRPFTTKDVWGFMDSQETVSISPEMFEEFIFPCYERIANQYGLLSYGCCEPVHPIWDNCLSKFEHLRKVSISPWCDEEFMGERLRGRKTIYHRKPFPNFLGVGETLDEEAFKKHINKTLSAARGCELEFTQRDVYSINHDIPKAHRYVELIRECIAENWQG